MGEPIAWMLVLYMTGASTPAPVAELFRTEQRCVDAGESWVNAKVRGAPVPLSLDTSTIAKVYTYSEVSRHGLVR